MGIWIQEQRLSNSEQDNQKENRNTEGMQSSERNMDRILAEVWDHLHQDETVRHGHSSLAGALSMMMHRRSVVSPVLEELELRLDTLDVKLSLDGVTIR